MNRYNGSNFLFLKKLLQLLIVILLLCSSLESLTQIPNKLNYDKKRYHFGLIIGYNQMLYNIKRIEFSPISDTLYGIGSFFAPGFHVGFVIPDLRLGEYLNLRLLPNLSFNDRRVEYYLKTNNSSELTETHFKYVESVFADIPLELKIRSKRWYNFRPYLIVGVRYTFDLLSLRKIKNLDDREKLLKIEPNDFLYTTGVGFDFYYFKYCKFAIELKMSFGLHNLLINEGNIYTEDIKSITSRVFNLTFTFE